MVILAKLPARDREETELMWLDREFRRDWGPEQVWMTVQWQQYTTATTAIHQRYQGRRAA